MFQKTISWIRSNYVYTYHGRMPRKPFIILNLIFWSYVLLLYGLFKSEIIFQFSGGSLSFTSPFQLHIVPSEAFSVIFFLLGLTWLIFNILLFIFMIFQTVRRLHDINRSGWWWLVTLITINIFSMNTPSGVLTVPLPFGLVLDVILCIADGTVGPNQYGADPKHRVIACADNVCDEESGNIVANENLSN